MGTPDYSHVGSTPTFVPVADSTIDLAVGGTATQAGKVALPAVVATCYRILNPAGGVPVRFVLTTDATKAAAAPSPYQVDGTGGSVGAKRIDAGGVEIFGLSGNQQAALAAGALFISAIAIGGTTTLSLTLGSGI